MSEKLIDCVAAKAFTSTQFGNLSQGDPLQVSQKRFNVWKEQGLVDVPKGQKVVEAKVEAPVETPVETPAPKATGKRKGKRAK